jgi:hypothetical protein
MVEENISKPEFEKTSKRLIPGTWGVVQKRIASSPGTFGNKCWCLQKEEAISSFGIYFLQDDVRCLWES